jgi:hypothetical protein
VVKFYYSGDCKSKRPLIIDDKKKLWLKRMIVGEGGRNCSATKANALIVAIINRWFLWKGSRKYPTFISMMRAFSQPINRRWMTGGDLARKYIGRNAASKQRLARRAQICAMTKFPRIINSIVEALQNGENIIIWKIGETINCYTQRISNWASLKSTPKKYPWGMDIDGDWFFEDKNLISGVVCSINSQSST